MKITVVCKECVFQDTDPFIEINFVDSTIYYVCPKCKKMNQMSVKVENKPYAKSRRLGH